MVYMVEKKPQFVVIHVGTNDLKGADTASQIARRIVDLATRCFDCGSQVLVSELINRGDQLNGKQEHVNEILQVSWRKTT